jgi:hypothetical protein
MEDLDAQTAMPWSEQMEEMAVKGESLRGRLELARKVVIKGHQYIRPPREVQRM